MSLFFPECAEDGREAVELYRKRKEEGVPFSAVIMDLTIQGGMGGKDAIDLLLRLDPEVKAIVSSGYSTDPVVARFREYGFCAMLGKPYRLEEVSAALRESQRGDCTQGRRDRHRDEATLTL